MSSKAILIGISDYGPYGDLPMIASEMKRLKQLLESELHPGYRFDRVEQHLNVNYDQLEQTFTDEHAESPIERMFIYVAGHGCTRTDAEYFVLPEENPRKPGMRLDTLVALIEKIPVAKKFVVFDFCRSGGAVEMLREKGLQPVTSLGLKQPPKMALLASCARKQDAPAGRNEPSLTSLFISSFTDNPGDREGTIYWRDIVDYIDGKMRRSTVAAPQSIGQDLRLEPWQLKPPTSRIAVLRPKVTPRDRQAEAQDFVDDIVRVIAKQRELDLVPSQDIRKYKPSVSRTLIAENEKARYIVEITASYTDKEANFRVELVDNQRNASLLVEPFRKKKRDRGPLLRLASNIATAILGALGIHVPSQKTPRPLTPTGKLAKRPKAPSKAFLNLLRDAEHHFYLRTESGLRTALAKYTEAARTVEDDPRGHAGIALCHVLLGGCGYEFESPADAGPKAIAAAYRALECDEENADAHLALGAAYHDFVWDHQLAEREYKESTWTREESHHLAVRATAYEWYGVLLLQWKRFDEALSALLKAEQYSSAPIILANIALAYGFAGNSPSAANYFRRLDSLAPDFPITSYFRGQLLAADQRFAEAAGEFRKAAQLSGERPVFRAFEAYADAARGHTTEAEKRLLELKAPFHSGIVLLGLGRHDEAIHQLDRVVSDGSPWATWLNVHPMFNPIRTAPAFIDVLKRASTPRRELEHRKESDA